MTFRADPHDLASVPAHSPRTLPVLLSLVLHALAGLLLWRVEVDRPTQISPVATAVPVRIRLVSPQIPIPGSPQLPESPAEAAATSIDSAPTAPASPTVSSTSRPREPAVSVPAVPEHPAVNPPERLLPPMDHTRTALGLRRLIDDLFTDAAPPGWDCTPGQRRNDLLDCGDDPNPDISDAARNPTYDALTAAARSATTRRSSTERESRLAEALGSSGTDSVAVDAIMRTLNPTAQERHTATEARTGQLQGQMLRHDAADQLRRRIMNAP